MAELAQHQLVLALGVSLHEDGADPERLAFVNLIDQLDLSRLVQEKRSWCRCAGNLHRGLGQVDKAKRAVIADDLADVALEQLVVVRTARP